MKEVTRSDWDYTLYADSGTYKLTVACGNAGVYEVEVLLNGAEMLQYKHQGDTFLKNLAAAVRAAPEEYRTR